MGHIDLLIAYAKARQDEMLQAAQMYRQVKELKRDERRLRVNILSRLGAALFAPGMKVKAQKRTQASALKGEGVGSEANLCC